MTTAVHIRQGEAPTIAEVIDQINDERVGMTTQDIPVVSIDFRFTDDNPHFRISGEEVPASKEGILAFSSYLGVPTPFMKRVGDEIGLDLQQRILTDLLQAKPVQALRVTTVEGGVKAVVDTGLESYDPIRLLRVAQRVLHTDEALIQRLVNQPNEEFSFDVHVPFDSERGVGGDATSLVEAPEALLRKSWISGTTVTGDSRVGDITATGLRMSLDIKHNLTPTVQTWFMRLACTNGMEVETLGNKIDGRGLSVDEVLAELEAKAQIAFANAERDVAHFYELRNQNVSNPERALTAMARERGIPDRSLMRLLTNAPTLVNPSRFDLINLVTNLANDPATIRDGGRQLLERAGGGVISDSMARCPHCEQGIGHAH